MTKENRPAIFANFQDAHKFGSLGRHLFSILYAFSISNYRIDLLETKHTKELGNRGKLISSINSLRFVKSTPDNSEDYFYLYDKEGATYTNKKWKKRIQVKFDIFSRYLLASLRKKTPILMPFGLHPVHCSADLLDRLENYRLSGKKVRIFFQVIQRTTKTTILSTQNPSYLA